VTTESMNAALVTSFQEPPHYRTVAVPTPSNPNEILIEVLAAGLHPRVRSGAAGAHYTSTGTLPLIPGVDGVGRRSDGTKIYFAVDGDGVGSMADKAVVDVRRAIELPDDVDELKIAAAMNPAMSSWVALRRRVPTDAGQSVLILGATGNAGTMAVQIAKRLGAARVVGAGRDITRLNALPGVGADEIVALSPDRDATAAALGAAAADVDIVIDYLWGVPAQEAMMALLTQRSDRGRALHWIQIGAVAGPTIELPSVALRSTNLRLQGCGQGSVSPKEYLAELPSLVGEITTGSISVSATRQRLQDVEEIWGQSESSNVRTVLIP
jgi:NADPH:quinone reductase-like Zn-dependent oxidoreductase